MKNKKTKIGITGLSSVFGVSSIDTIETEEFIFEVFPYDDLDYDFRKFDGLIILPNAYDYRVRNNNGEAVLEKNSTDENLIPSRQKELEQLLIAGKWCCFCHYDLLDEYTNEYGNKYDISDTSLFKRIMNRVAIERVYARGGITNPPVKSDYFGKYIKEFGISKIKFTWRQYDSVDERIFLIAGRGGSATGFKIDSKLFVMPLNLFGIDEESLLKALSLLATSILQYNAANQLTLPPWLEEIEFKEESVLLEEIEILKSELLKKERSLVELRQYKALLTSTGEPLRLLAMECLSNFFGIKLDENDSGASDFKILHENDNGIKHLVEVKGSVSGLKNDHISQFVSHRVKESVKIETPGLLLINNNSKISGLKERQKYEPHKDQIEIAEQQGITILRTVDLIILMLKVERLPVKERAEIFLKHIEKPGYAIFADECD